MNFGDPMETGLESLGRRLRETPSRKEAILRALRGARPEPDPHLPDRPVPRGARRAWSWLGAAAAFVALAMVIALSLLPHSSVGWAQMSEAMRAQRWIHAAATYEDGKSGELWISPERKVWAFRSDDRLQFGDEGEGALYEFDRRRKQLVKLPLGEQSVARIFPLGDLSQEDSTVGPWLFGTEKVIAQTRREVTDMGRQWVEFDLTLWRGAKYVILRVDPRTKLPVYLVSRTSPDAAPSSRWMFDYPKQGPGTIHDLGVPRGTLVDDRMPPGDALRIIERMSASRARLGDFRLVTYRSDNGSLRDPTSIVWRKGRRWRIDQIPPWETRASSPPAADQSLDDWLAAQRRFISPQFVCDGKNVYRNANAHMPGMVRWERYEASPDDLLSGERSGARFYGVDIVRRFYPDLTVPQGIKFEFDPKPAGAQGLALIRISASLAGGGTGHEWYFIDPARGCAVVRTHMFNLADGRKRELPDPGRQTTRMEGFRQSPTGFWYPTSVHESRVGGTEVRNGKEITRDDSESTLEYRFEFEAELPDSLFEVGP